MCRCAGVQASEANEGELASFVAYACAFPAKCLCLVDNYDVIRYCWLWRDCMYRGVGWLPCPTSDVQKQLMEVCARVSSSVCCSVPRIDDHCGFSSLYTLSVPCIRTVGFGLTSFPVAGQLAWNSLPPELKTTSLTPGQFSLFRSMSEKM